MSPSWSWANAVMPITNCSPSGLIHSCSVVYRRSPGLSPAPTAKLVLLLVRLHFGARPRTMRHEGQRDHLGRGRLAAHLHRQLAASVAQPERHVAHGDVLLERGRKRPAGHPANPLVLMQDRKLGPRHAAWRNPQPDQSARRPGSLDLRQPRATYERCFARADHPAQTGLVRIGRPIDVVTIQRKASFGAQRVARAETARAGAERVPDVFGVSSFDHDLEAVLARVASARDQRSTTLDLRLNER